ncbi:BMC domain-containing protein [Facklamia sp. DSM 111019]|nr:BMC domain-containing protein [Facklamia lactis]
MSSNALGMIEVKGLLGSIIAADIAVKAANVHLIGNQTIKGGLTNVELFGDVGAINEAVYAAEEAVKGMGCYISSNVIANLDPQVEEMLLKSFDENRRQDNKAKDELIEVEEIVEQVVAEKDTEISNAQLTIPQYRPVIKEFLKENNKEKLEDLKVTELRSLAYKMELKKISKKEIKFAKKDEIIKSIEEEGVE